MFATALILGLASSLHCLGMCSPLMMAATNLSRPVIVNRLIYNSGRVLTYAVFGTIASFFGSAIDFSSAQQIITVLLGSLLILAGITGSLSIKVPVVSTALNHAVFFLKKTFQKFLVQKNNWAMFSMGMINGVLPCGITYLALIYCFTLPSATDGFLFMLFVGAGTLPAMMGAPALIDSIRKIIPFSVNKMATVFMIIIGTFLIARGFTNQQILSNHFAGQTPVCLP